jgi:hypothetical protein
MTAKDLIELLRSLPTGSKTTLQRKEFEALFRGADQKQRAETIARLNNCILTLDENGGPATFTRVH